MHRTLALACALALPVAGCRPDPTPAAHLANTAGARAFVVEFYGWYYGRPDSTKNIDTLMARRRAWLVADLAALLDSDNACAARAHGICDLDEDPILAAQDPCERYEVGGALARNDTVGVSVFGVCNGTRDTIPAVIAMVVPHDSGWQFTNFVYPAEKTDLRSILSQKTNE